MQKDRIRNRIVMKNAIFTQSAFAGQVSSVEVWAWPFRTRWKGRLGISLRGYNFYSVLRMDYATDWIAFLFLSNYFLTLLFAGRFIVMENILCCILYPNSFGVVITSCTSLLKRQLCNFFH
jgi:hypothetical protein